MWLPVAIVGDRLEEVVCDWTIRRISDKSLTSKESVQVGDGETRGRIP
jgi:uncharacterized membrane protein